MIKNLISSILSGFFLILFLRILFYFVEYTPSLTNLFVGFLFWIIICFIVLNFYSMKFNDALQNTEEDIIYKCIADHYSKQEISRGHIILTKNKFIYSSFNNNITEISLNDIIEVKPYNNFGIIPNGLAIIQKDKTDKFVVNNRKKIIDILYTFMS